MTYQYAKVYSKERGVYRHNLTDKQMKVVAFLVEKPGSYIQTSSYYYGQELRTAAHKTVQYFTEPTVRALIKIGAVKLVEDAAGLYPPNLWARYTLNPEFKTTR
jgi:hypothetical protein